MINIGTTKEPTIIIFDDDVQEQPLRYYVEKLRSFIILEDTRIDVDMDCIANLGELTKMSKKQLLHSTRSQTPFCLKSLLFLPHLLARKACKKKPLIDYN